MEETRHPSPVMPPLRNRIPSIIVSKTRASSVSATGDTNSVVIPLEKELQALKEAMLQVPGITGSMNRSAVKSYIDSPFVDSIANAKLPKKLVYPTFVL